MRLDPFARAGARLHGERRGASPSGAASDRGDVRPTSAPIRDLAIDNFADLPEEERDPHWYKRAVFYEVLVRGVRRQQRRRHRRPQRPDREARLPAVARRRLHLAAAVLPLPAARRRLRRQRLHRRAAGVRHLGDFVEFVDAAHSAGHPGDHRLRHEPHVATSTRGSRPRAPTPTGPYGDFYVWADTDEAYADARIIFVDTETSNWTFDPVRKQYFWHRFFSHQPDLNFENPRVQDAMIEALKFWLDLGIDGFRLDAVPYLFEEEGTNCENLPADPRVPQAGAQGGRRAVPRPGAALRGQPVAQRRRRVLRRGRRRVPDGVPLPGDAAAVHGRAPGVALPDLRDHGADAGDPGQLPVGHLPAQPRRADARDGHRRRARLHVRASTPRTRG